MDATTNGQAPKPVKEQLREARRRIKLLHESVQLKRLEQTAALYETYANYDWVTVYQDQLAKWRHGEPGSFSIATANDRRRGQNFPLFRNEQELAMIRMPSRILCSANSYAIGLLEGLTSYVVGMGFQYRAAPIDKTKAKRLGPLLAAVQRIIDGFLALNQWRGGEQPGLEEELFWRSCEDGEFLLCHYCDELGRTRVRTVEPEQLTQKPGGRWEEWSFGIQTPEDDAQRPLAYWIFFGASPADGQEYRPEQIIHYRRNVKRSIKRGMPDFAWDTYDALEIASKLRRAMGIGGAEQAATVGIRQHDTATASQVQSFVDELADYQRTNPVTLREEDFRKAEPGWKDIPKGMNYVPPPGYANHGAFIDILHACLRGAGVRWNAPEWLSTASGADMAAYTASLTAESPFVRTVQRRQAGLKAVFGRSAQIAVENWFRVNGEIVAIEQDGETHVERRYPWDEVRRLITVECEPTDVQVRKELEEAQQAAIEIPLGLDSRQRYVASKGRDWQQIQADNEEYQEQSGGRQMMLPGMGEGGGGNPFGGMESEFLESEWDEAKHKRASDGKFGSGGGGSSSRQPDGAKAKIAGKIAALALSAKEKVAAIQAAVKKHGKAVWDKLPKPAQKALTIAHAIEHKISSPMRAGHALAIEVARQRGLGEEHAAKIGRIVGIADTAIQWTVAVPVAHQFAEMVGLHGIGALVASKGGALVPVASLAYVAYSTTRNPLATIRAAHAMYARRKTTAKHEAIMEGVDEEAVGLLLERLDQHGGSEWYLALVHAAYDRTQDLAKAIKLADAAIAKQPEEPK